MTGIYDEGVKINYAVFSGPRREMCGSYEN
jgi:hypothetical protein